MRSLLRLAAGMATLGLAACAAERDELEPIEPGSVAREDAKRRAVRCAADEGGNLHVRAPADARVTTQASDDPTVEIEYGSADPSAYQMPRPQRPMSRSLGFIGDAPLSQGPNYGGRYSYGAHDDLLPPHAHHADWTGRASFGRGWGYRSHGYGQGYSQPHGYGPRR
jgi:hypothetical protein